MMGQLIWRDEFPGAYDVPHRFSTLVLNGTIEDLSFRGDPCPSFGRKLGDKKWVRLWVEHPIRLAREGWPARFTVMIQPDLTVLFGRKVLSTEDPEKARRCVLSLLKKSMPRSRFRTVWEA